MHGIIARHISARLGALRVKLILLCAHERRSLKSFKVSNESSESIELDRFISLNGAGMDLSGYTERARDLAQGFRSEQQAEKVRLQQIEQERERLDYDRGLSLWRRLCLFCHRRPQPLQRD
jgi:hypothetical protein